jgi:hypothetical protein
VIDRHPLNAAREVDGPGHSIGIGRIHLRDDRHFLRSEILVPADLLEHSERELGIAVLDLGSGRIGAVGEQIRPIALDAEARAERATAFLYRRAGVVENRSTGVLEFRRAPARLRQSVNFAAHFRIVLWRA